MLAYAMLPKYMLLKICTMPIQDAEPPNSKTKLKGVDTILKLQKNVIG